MGDLQLSNIFFWALSGEDENEKVVNDEDERAFPKQNKNSSHTTCNLANYQSQ